MYVVGVAVVAAAVQAQEEAPASSVAAAPGAEVPKLIEQLGAPDYQARLDATRQLCRIGPAALEPLRAAQRHESFEIAARAQHLVRLLERQYFGGVRVTLSVSKTRFAWNEPIDLTIAFTNPSSFDARLPFDAGAGSAGDTDADLAQVRGMIDAGEYLEVTDAAGNVLDLRVDDVAESPAIARLIRERAESGPVEILSPGHSAIIRLTAFNRGWARFPLLAPGAATVRFRYLPQWPQEEPFLGFEKDGVGAVVSEPLKLTIEPGAPPGVSSTGRTANVVVERQGEEYVAYLICLYDRPVAVNAHFGTTPPFAQLRWTCRVGDEDRILTASDGGRLAEFTGDRFLNVEPGSRVELSRIAVARVRETADALPAPSGSPALVAAYVNVASRAWQIEQADRDTDPWKSLPDAARRPFPPRVVTGHLRSDPIQVEPR
ncbi:MAG: hypothetical protein BroJett003_15850 [Planctomycetota bacterium]|nr:MAG: hypothetical protein BroJett003_15850 [Planctomycetota bacterium]